MPMQPMIVLTRKQLYDEVWSIAVTGVSKKYGIPYSALLNQIKSVDIPIPPSGYWTKLEFGKAPAKTELTGDFEQTVPLYGSVKTVTAVRKGKDLPKTEVPVEPVEKPASTDAETVITPSPLGEAEVRETWNGKKNVYHREQLYQEVWQYPVTEVAKKYAVSDVAIHKICKSLDIPTPPPGYWAKVRAGKSVAVTPLPKSDKGEIKTGFRTGYEPTASDTERLSFLNEEEMAMVLTVASQVLLPDEEARMHPKIVAHRKAIRNWEKEAAQPRNYWERGKERERLYLMDGINEATIPRVCRVIDALIKAMEPLGWSLDDELFFHYKEDKVRLGFTEAQDKVSHVLTSEEHKQMLNYEEEKKRYAWASKPNIRKYDYNYNGRITVSINKKYFRDGKSYQIEDRLGDIMIELYVAVNDARLAREAKEEAERKRQEEERRKEELRARYNAEVKRTLALENEAEDYAVACKIRAFIAAIEAQGLQDEETVQWLAWAKAKADWYDPIVSAEDPLFGKRRHGADAENKRPKEKSWYGW